MNDADLDRLVDRLVEKLASRLPQDLPRLLDIPAAAHYMGRTEEAVRHLVKKGTLPGTKVDGKLQLDRFVIDKLIADSTFWPAA